MSNSPSVTPAEVTDSGRGMGLRLAGLAPVGAEGPAVALRVAGREIAGAVVGVVRRLEDLGAGRRGAGEQRVRLAGDHVRAERARLDWPPVVGIRIACGAEHDPAPGRPGQLRAGDAL